MISNIANRNVSLILFIGCLAGLIYCTTDVIHNGKSWIGLTAIILPTALFLKFYLTYSKAVKKGNMYGKVNPWK